MSLEYVYMPLYPDNQVQMCIKHMNFKKNEKLERQKRNWCLVVGKSLH